MILLHGDIEMFKCCSARTGVRPFRVNLPFTKGEMCIFLIQMNESGERKFRL
jgi:hypothetical protein